MGRFARHTEISGLGRRDLPKAWSLQFGNPKTYVKKLGALPFVSGSAGLQDWSGTSAFSLTEARGIPAAEKMGPTLRA